MRTRWILLGFAALFHLTLLLTPSPLTNDLYRYEWDGKLLAHGVNPYTYPPAAEEVAALRDGHWEQIFNRDVPTGYPPLAEALFAAAYRIRPGIWTLRALAALASLGTAWLLLLAQHAAGGDERRALLYAWSPLVALEFGNSGHLDAYALLFLSGALLLALRGRRMGAAVWLALGALAKFFPLLLLPLWGWRWRKGTWLAAALVFVLPWLPLLPGGSPFKGLGIFGGRGEFNDSLYRLVEDGWYLALQSSTARLWARGSIGVGLAGLYLALVWRSRKGARVLDGWQWAGVFFGACLLLSPVIHPWYVCWMLAFLAVDGCGPTGAEETCRGSLARQTGEAWTAAWLVLSVTMIFARVVYIGVEQSGVWEEPGWSWLVVWAPYYAVWGWGMVRNYREGQMTQVGS